MTSKEIAAQILELVGKESNIISCTHCVTRLRFSLRDDGKADRKKYNLQPALQTPCADSSLCIEQCVSKVHMVAE